MDAEVFTDERRAARVIALLGHAREDLDADGERRLARVLALLETATARRAATEG